ncbi:MAG: hypothetical protein A4E57_04588 [Syntrophorhabdaceae bacterium PtaU1.Bin034]|nr:MAG: hypothetical protein A4E57_04588 [Syntrophorhabdaceae bacterium PtaU1.Bin034]
MHCLIRLESEVDGHDNGTAFPHRKKDAHKLHAISRPYGDSVTRLKAGARKAAGQPINEPVQLVVRKELFIHDEGFFAPVTPGIQFDYISENQHVDILRFSYLFRSVILQTSFQTDPVSHAGDNRFGSTLTYSPPSPSPFCSQRPCHPCISSCRVGEPGNELREHKNKCRA